MAKSREEILELLQKLVVRTADSGATQGEAEAALLYAQRLMSEYNISMFEVDEFAPKSYNAKWITRTAWEGKGRPWQMGFVCNVMKYFFVKPLYSGNHMYGSASVLLFGEEENVENAVFVFNYLNETFRKLWDKERRIRGYSHGESRAFYSGLAKGLCSKLEEARGQMQRINSTGLIVAEKALDRELSVHHPDLVKGAPRAPIYGKDAYNNGYQQGRKIQIQTSQAKGHVGSQSHAS